MWSDFQQNVVVCAWIPYLLIPSYVPSHSRPQSPHLKVSHHGMSESESLGITDRHCLPATDQTNCLNKKKWKGLSLYSICKQRHLASCSPLNLIKVPSVIYVLHHWYVRVKTLCSSGSVASVPNFPGDLRIPVQYHVVERQLFPHVVAPLMWTISAPPIGNR